MTVLLRGTVLQSVRSSGHRAYARTYASARLLSSERRMLWQEMSVRWAQECACDVADFLWDKPVTSSFHHRLVINNVQGGPSLWTSLSSHFMSCTSDIYDIVGGIHVLVSTTDLHTSIQHLNLHNSVVFFPLISALFPQSYSILPSWQKFYLIIGFATDIYFLLTCWKLSHIQRTRPRSWTRITVTEKWVTRCFTAPLPMLSDTH